MTHAPLPRPIIILGPTAGGKSDLAVRLAETLDGQIIGADSMQIYRYMDAGTAKPTTQARRCVKHHLIDMVDPTERFTVADWLEQAETLISEIQSSNQTPIIVGGTNLYIKALLEGLFTGPPADPVVREQLAKLSAQQLYDQLKTVDPDAARQIHPNDRKKLVRAIEVYHTTGQRISNLQNQWNRRPTDPPNYRHNPILIGLDWPVESINHRINQRVKTMFYPQLSTDQEVTRDISDTSFMPESLPQEVLRLEQQGILGPQAREALGYKQILNHLQGTYSLEQAFEKTKIQTRHFAKNQRTWLKRFRSVRWIPMGNRGWTDKFDEILLSVTSLK